MSDFALLAPGETLHTAQAELTTAGRRAATALPATHQHLEGEQCLDTPNGPIRARAGQGAVVAENIPMRLFNTGAGIRRALFIVIHDPSMPEASTSPWTPSGACSR